MFVQMVTGQVTRQRFQMKAHLSTFRSMNSTNASTYLLVFRSQLRKVHFLAEDGLTVFDLSLRRVCFSQRRGNVGPYRRRILR